MGKALPGDLRDSGLGSWEVRLLNPSQEKGRARDEQRWIWGPQIGTPRLLMAGKCLSSGAYPLPLNTGPIRTLHKLPSWGGFSWQL